MLIQLTELIIVSVLKTCKNLEGTCHLLFFVDVLRQHACQLRNSLSCTFTIIQNIGMYDVCTMVTCIYLCTILTDPFLNLHLLPVVSAYLTPSSQLPSFPTNRYRIQQQYLPKMHLSFPFKRRELFN